ncbi:MAG TPA: aminoglycoside phosphotransferase family protein [Actinoplanes sp.]|nr:aminoglycoside phosphotransferase family protein [Actinoplanes sp.]
MAAQPMPAAEVEVSAELVRRLLAEQHPDLAGLAVRPGAHGWDNVTFRLGAKLAVRLPRRALGATLIKHEQQWLGRIAAGLPLPVPAPLRLGRPGCGYPWAWSVVPWFAGAPAAVAPPADPRAAAVTLAAFLAALHTSAPSDAPANPYRGVPLAARDELLTDRLATLGPQVDGAAVRRCWQQALAVPGWAGPPLWLHGDLHPGNILTSRGRLTAVIDFGDLTAGDPAVDLSAAWMLLPASTHGAFRSAYAQAAGYNVNTDVWDRARGWALALSLAFLGGSADHPPLAAVGRRTLDAALSIA